MPLAARTALAHALVEARPRQRVGDRIADVVERKAAGEVDAAEEGVGRLAQVADHEEARRLDARSDARLDRRAGLVRRDAFLHLLQHIFVARLDAEEDALAAGAMHLLEERPVNVRDAT